MTIGRFIYRFRWQVVLLWLGAAGALALFSPRAEAMLGLTSDPLPADAPVRKALAELSRHFRDGGSLSQAVLVFERSEGPLTRRDLEAIERLAGLLRPPAPAEDWRGVTLRTPRALAILGDRNPLRSADGRAALVVLDLPHSHASTRAVRIVNHIHAVLKAHALPAGLTVETTGGAGYGRDSILANERSHDKVLAVTVAAVIAILLVVYRAPLAAAVPLVAIGIASLVATKVIVLGKDLGLSAGTAERLFMLVLLYGAGVDYSLLFISRYREFLDDHYPHAEAFARGLDASLGAVLSSAATTAAGLAMLCFARFGIFRDVGPANVLALVTAAVASTTLTPAMVAILGPRTFWPRRPAPLPPDAALPGVAAAGTPSVWMPQRLWGAVARLVTRRPGLVLACTLAALALPSARGLRQDWDYNAQASLPRTYGAVRGMEMIRRHWVIGEMAPVIVLAVADSPQPADRWRSASARLVARLRAVEGVGDVRSLTAPLGMGAGPGAHAADLLSAGRRVQDEILRTDPHAQLLLAALRASPLATGVDLAAGAAGLLWAAGRVQAEFLSPDGQAMRLFVMLKHAPETLRAMDDAPRIRAAAEEALAQAGLPARVHLAGPTAETLDLRDITQSDFYRTAGLALAVILAIVLALLRDWRLSLFLVAATVLGYLATLGLTCWAFRLAGQQGLDWEVGVFLFIVLVAVGQDYNLFFAVRLAQEAARLPLARACEETVIHTGRVISSCGLIMAATLGSLVAADIRMLQQLGFALALGMLIDTFVVRPLLLPSFIVLTGRTLARAAAFLR